MGQSTKHDMRHSSGLRYQRIVQSLVVIAMNCTPPRRHSIDYFTLILILCIQDQLTSVCCLYGVHRQRIHHRGIGMPYVFPVKLQKSLCFFREFHGIGLGHIMSSFPEQEDRVKHHSTYIPKINLPNIYGYCSTAFQQFSLVDIQVALNFFHQLDG